MMGLLGYLLLLLTSLIYFGQTEDSALKLVPRDSTALAKYSVEKKKRLAGNVPNPFIWRPDPYHRLVFHRKPLSKDRLDNNPGTSPNNWRHAVYQASDKIARLQHQAGVGLTDPIPDDHFQYSEAIARAGAGALREIIFEMDGVPLFNLEYGRVHTILYGLLEYEKIWVKPSKNDLIRMCNFTVWWTPGPQYLVAHGRAIISLETIADVNLIQIANPTDRVAL
ncbi:MAG: hypothetical protein Q9213_005478 [Squamulea squamosa]